MTTDDVPKPLIDLQAARVASNALRSGVSRPVVDDRDRTIRKNPWMHER